MSMHEIEALVECSVLVLDAANPMPADARDLCYSLYELQDQFDCGYTVLRVPDELERLGYLRRLPPERLPEPDRFEALALTGCGGFFGESSETYFDEKSGLCYVTAGSPLWEKLCRERILPATDGGPVHPFSALELAERIAALAAAQGDENAAEAMGLWYAIFPAFLMLESETNDARDDLDPRVSALRDRLATPDAFAAAAAWRLLPSSDDLGACDLFDEQWLAPYAALITERKEGETQKRRIQEALQENDYATACRLADSLPDRAARVYYQAAASLCFHQQRADGEQPASFDGLMSLEQTRDVFTSLLSGRTEDDSLYYMSIAACNTFLGEYRRAFEALRDAFLPALERVRQSCEDPWTQRFTKAAIAVTFYHIVAENIPDSEHEKQRMMTERSGDLPTLAEARKTFAVLMKERPDEAWACHFQLGICLLLERDRDGARRELLEAEGMHPGDPGVTAALKLVAL